eukprot:1188517-Prorocentrum_minimum.AAC.1
MVDVVTANAAMGRKGSELRSEVNRMGRRMISPDDRTVVRSCAAGGGGHRRRGAPRRGSVRAAQGNATAAPEVGRVQGSVPSGPPSPSYASVGRRVQSPASTRVRVRVCLDEPPRVCDQPPLLLLLLPSVQHPLDNESPIRFLPTGRRRQSDPMRRTVALKIHIVALKIHTVALKIHNLALKIHTVSLKIHTVALKIHNFALKIRIVALKIHTVAHRLCVARVLSAARWAGPGRGRRVGLRRWRGRGGGGREGEGGGGGRPAGPVRQSRAAQDREAGVLSRELGGAAAGAGAARAGGARKRNAPHRSP